MNRYMESIELLKKELTITTSDVLEIARDFQKHLERALEGQGSSLMILPSFLGNPSGEERGTYLAFDFGGTNIRFMQVELQGGKYEINQMFTFPLRDPDKGYDYTAETCTGEELFDFIARQIALLVREKRDYSLGHTFSFPCVAKGLNQVALIKWSKEFKTSGVEGKDLGLLLREALKRQGLSNVIPRAVINDTTGILLSAAYLNSSFEIGSIIGTGHNTCYLEREITWSKEPVIIVLESGNYNGMPMTRFDILLDQKSDKPQSGLLEKMVSGRYLGELVQIIINEMAQATELFRGWEGWAVWGTEAFSAREISQILKDRSPELTYIAGLLKDKYQTGGSSYKERQALRDICQTLMTRSARLVAATYLGILAHMDPQLRRVHAIAVDGSIFQEMPGYSDIVNNTMSEVLGEKAPKVPIGFIKDGSGVGAAIAAAMTEHK